MTISPTSSTYHATLLRAGSFRLDGGGMFGLVPKSMWSKLVEPDERNRIPLQTNCLLLRDGVRTVLVETGFGDKWLDKEREIYSLERRTVVDALGEIGVSPAEITHVIVTHLHFDHAAGLTRAWADGTILPTFDNAEILVQRLEWEDALANKSTMSRTYLRSHLDPIADRVRVLEGEAAPLPGIAVEPVPGHTWGQQMVRFSTPDGPCCFAGDVMPTRNHAGLAFNMAYDMLPYENLLTKRRLLARASAEGWRLVLDHEPGHAVVSVRSDGADRWTLESAELGRG